MSDVFVDTSALVSLLDQGEANHVQAVATWTELLAAGDTLHTSNYVLLESSAVLQRKFGLASVRALREVFRPLLRVHWVTPEEHEKAEVALLTANRRQLSLVDCSSFVVMRHHGLQRCFAYDVHFEEQGHQMVG